MPSYAIYLTNGFRLDCKGRTISHAIALASKEFPQLVPIMTANYLTYKNGIGDYNFQQTDKSRQAVALAQFKAIQKSEKES